MIARPATALPPAGPAGFAIEPKYDGWRALAFATVEKVLQSRHQRPLERYFPEVVAAVAALDHEVERLLAGVSPPVALAAMTTDVAVARAGWPMTAAVSTGYSSRGWRSPTGAGMPPVGGRSRRG